MCIRDRGGKLTMTDGEQQGYSLQAFPNELVVLILDFLDGKSLRECRLVSKAWQDIATSDTLWKRRYLHYFSRQPWPEYVWIGFFDTAQPQKDFFQAISEILKKKNPLP
eukprot:TRINITY_DN10660_c0_g1_i1.p1 TRINITY_DN10660_c0_g1~~TRINITY_DN10660_c0_g1_i1.p1  ORF type:complete len:109 (+),score=17.10 TRINITY_DN10660_c0_g1_i1:2-328(+)